MNARLCIQIVIGTVGYSAWGCMAFFDHALLPDFLKFNIGMALGTIGLALRDMPPAAVAAPQADLPAASQTASQTGPQAGYAKPVLLGFVVLGMASLILAAHPNPKPMRASPLL